MFISINGIKFVYLYLSLLTKNNNYEKWHHFRLSLSVKSINLIYSLCFHKLFLYKLTEKQVIQLIHKLHYFPNHKVCVKVGIGKNVVISHVCYKDGFSNSDVLYAYFLIKDFDKVK